MIALATVAIAASLLLYRLYTRRNIRKLGTVASASLASAALLLLAELTLRGILAWHWPLGSQYEFTLGFAVIVVVIYLLTERQTQERRGGAGVALVLLGLLSRALSMSAQARALGPLPPVLKSVWLQAHVLTVMVGYGCIAVAAGLGLTALETSPASMTLRSMVRRLLEIGFPWLTLGILTGAMWAHSAWGRYWGWDPKETWSLITWLWYLAILHRVPASRRNGRTLIWLTLIGFALVMFTFIGVPALARSLSLDTLHGY